VTTNDPELQPIVTEHVANLKLDAPVKHHLRSEFIQTARERKEYEGEEGDQRSIEPAILANIIKNKLLEMDHTLMKEKKEKLKPFQDKLDSEEAKSVLYGIDAIHIM